MQEIEESKNMNKLSQSWLLGSKLDSYRVECVHKALDCKTRSGVSSLILSSFRLEGQFELFSNSCVVKLKKRV